MIEFHGIFNIGEKNMDSVTEMDDVAEIAHILFSPSLKTSRALRTLFLAAITGAVSVSQVLLGGEYGDYRHRGTTSVTNFLWSLSKSRGFLERKTDGRVSDVGLFTVTREGYDCIEKNIRQLADKGVFDDKGRTRMLDAAHAFCESAKKRKWKQPRNISHSNGINDFPAALMPICSSPVSFLRELNVYQIGDTLKADSYIRYHGSNSFRMDACVSFGTDVRKLIFYEQDTGTQSGTAIAGKMDNYRQLMSEFSAGGADNGVLVSPCLLFGLQCSYDTSSRTKAQLPDSGRDTRTVNARNQLLSHLQFYTDMSGVDDIPSVITAAEQAYKETSSALYKRCLDFLREFCASNPEVGLISDIRMYLSTDPPSLDADAGVCDVLADISVFLRRRDIFLERFLDADMEYCCRKGIRVCVAPNAAMDYYLPFLFPADMNMQTPFERLLCACGIGSARILSPVSEEVIFGTVFPNVCHILTSGGRKRIVIFENYSLELSSHIRIPDLCLQHSLVWNGVPVSLVVFFMDSDLSRVRDFAVSCGSGYCPPDSNAAFLSDASLGEPCGEILYVCMDAVSAALSGRTETEPAALVFLADGTGIYRQVLNTATFLPVRRMLPAGASGCGDACPFQPIQ